MPKSTAQLSASCFAALACLLCFSAAPVAGQNMGQSTPAASPPVSSPAPTPTVVPTPIPIQITVTNAPAPIPATSPATTAMFLGLTAADWKAVLLSAIPVVLGFIFATITASFITKQSELQKQRMELYKMLFSERLTVVKNFSGAVTDLHRQICILHAQSEQKDLIDLKEYFNNAVTLSNSNAWLLHSNVSTKMDGYLAFVRKILEGQIIIDSTSADNILNKSNSETAEILTAVRTMMLDDDLSHLVKKKSPY